MLKPLYKHKKECEKLLCFIHVNGPQSETDFYIVRRSKIACIVKIVLWLHLKHLPLHRVNIFTDGGELQATKYSALSKMMEEPSHKW